jgi:hypothetical protein
MVGHLSGLGVVQMRAEQRAHWVRLRIGGRTRTKEDTGPEGSVGVGGLARGEDHARRWRVDEGR